MTMTIEEHIARAEDCIERGTSSGWDDTHFYLQEAGLHIELAKLKANMPIEFAGPEVTFDGILPCAAPALVDGPLDMSHITAEMITADTVSDGTPPPACATARKVGDTSRSVIDGGSIPGNVTGDAINAMLSPGGYLGPPPVGSLAYAVAEQARQHVGRGLA